MIQYSLKQLHNYCVCKQVKQPSTGVVPAMSVDTGEITDIAITSKYSDECANWSWLPKDDLEKWQWQHDIVERDRNHFESSPAMEIRAAETMWGRSLELHNMRYRYYVSDGDSKGFSASRVQTIRRHSGRQARLCQPCWKANGYSSTKAGQKGQECVTRGKGAK